MVLHTTSGITGNDYLPANSLTGPGVLNHPVGIIPSAGISVPSDWPLSANGAITCMTCHASLPVPDSKPKLRGSESSTNGGPRAFCANCHVDGALSKEGAHWTALLRAHVSREYNQDTTAVGSSIESESRICLGCHDGVNASEASFSAAGAGFSADLADRARNHPIGVFYPKAGKKRAEVPLRPMSRVPASINLRGGVVNCLSCHDLYNHEKASLAVPIEGSKLCFSCHDLN